MYMLKLTFTYKGRQWQIEGEEDQLVSFLSSFPEGETRIGSFKPISMEEKPQHKAQPSHKATSETIIDIPSPSNEEVKAYLLSKPNFTHDLFEIQEHFFERRFVSRGVEARMYNRTIHQLKEVRHEIEEEKHGKFKEIKGDIKGQKRYVFEQQLTLKVAE